MNLITRALNKIFKTGNQKELDRIKPLIEAINNQEVNFKALKDEEFKEKTFLLKKNIQEGRKIDSIIPEAFALVRESAKRVLNERHYDVQLIGGIFLHEGKIAEMKTGEGKTLVSTLPAYLNALAGKGVHVVTVNDYLAKRDSEWMGKVFNFTGLSTGCITNELEDEERKKNYNCDITYATNNELGFDYLRDNMKYDLAEMVQRDHHYCIVDEVDSILIDESRTPLIISGRSEDKSNFYILANKFINKLQKTDYEIDEKNKNAILTDVGIDKIEKLAIHEGILKNNNFYDPENLNLVHHVNQALKANFLFNKDVDYIVRENKVQIIDEFTGRVLGGRRFSDGLHQSIEAKENVEIQEENQTLASITYQNYFRLYKKLSGMTGTALTEAEEFFDIYKLNVVAIPTNRPMIRKDYNDQIFRTEKEKYLAITNKIIECNSTGQPVLVGTTSIEKSEKISKNLNEKKIKHSVLNAKQHEKEAKIVAEAGKIGAITIATNMAGRGTDIQLGGNKDFKDDDNQKNSEQILEDKNKVKSLGGLFIIGTERHESRRIDNQLRGRSGRQGNPGESIFFVSLEDDLMRIFGSEKLQSMLSTLGLKKGEVIEHKWLTSSIERAQKRVEGHNFDIRKQLLEFDNIIDNQRNIIYSKREMIIIDDIFNFIKETEEEFISNLLESEEDEIKNFYNTLPFLQNKNMTDKSIYLESFDEIKKQNNEEHKDIYEKILRQVSLTILDKNWHNHIQELTNIRMSVSLIGHAGKDPLNEFRKASFAAFNTLIYEIQKQMVLVLNNMNISHQDPKKIEEKNLFRSAPKKIGRNNSCPCGSGKKYKNCHGNISLG